MVPEFHDGTYKSLLVEGGEEPLRSASNTALFGELVVEGEKRPQRRRPPDGTWPRTGARRPTPPTPRVVKTGVRGKSIQTERKKKGGPS